MASCRRLALVLLAMLARPWIWLMLAVWVLWPVLSLLALLSNVMSPSATLTPVAIVSGPTVPPNGGADVREDRLATITAWHACGLAYSWRLQAGDTRSSRRTGIAANDLATGRCSTDFRRSSGSG